MYMHTVYIIYRQSVYTHAHIQAHARRHTDLTAIHVMYTYVYTYIHVNIAYISNTYLPSGTFEPRCVRNAVGRKRNKKDPKIGVEQLEHRRPQDHCVLPLCYRRIVFVRKKIPK